MKRRVLIILVALAGLSQRARADSFSISFLTDVSSSTVYAEQIRDRIWIDFTDLAETLGGKSAPKGKVIMWQFAKHELAIHPRKSVYSVRLNGDKRWKDGTLVRRAFFEQRRFMVPLDDLPALTLQSYRYHLQRRRLEVQQADDEVSDARRIDVKFTIKDRQVWAGSRWTNWPKTSAS
jgi:hypothetical protein